MRQAYGCPKVLALWAGAILLGALAVFDAAYATVSVTGVTLNGAASVTVQPGASILANVTESTSQNHTWASTSWQIPPGTVQCVPGPNVSGNGTHTTSFNITAPLAAGTYSPTFNAYRSNNCSTGAGSAFTLAGGVIVGASASASTVVASPTSVIADGVSSSTITVTLKDGAGNGVSGKTVTLSKSGGSSLITPASGTSNASGVVTFTVTDTLAEGPISYSATDTTDNNLAITQSASISFTANTVSAATSTVAASPSTVVADGVTASTITITLKNANGNPVPGKTVTLAKSGGSSVISAASGPSNASGVVTFTVTDTVAEGPITYTATSAPTTITQTANVTFIPNVPGAASSTVVASPASVIADGVTTSTITVTLLSATNAPVTGKTVTLTAGSGSSVISAASGLSNSSGVVTFTVTDTVAQSVIYTAKDTTDNITVTQTASVTFTVNTPNAANSTVSASPTIIPADGTTTSTITVTLLNANSNPVSGKTVTLTAGSGSSVISAASGPSNASGVVTFTVKDSTAESVTYTASDTTDSVTITASATVRFGATPGNSTVVASPTAVAADGMSTSTITITLKDASGNPVSGKTVQLTAGGGSSAMSTASGPSNASGQVTFTVTDAVVETVLYTATDVSDSVIVTQTASVQFLTVARSFNAYETSTPAGAIGGVINTKIAGATFSLDIIAVRSAAIDTTYSRAVQIELLNSSDNNGLLDTNNCRSTWSPIQTLSPNPGITNGRSTVSFTETNAWPDVRVRITSLIGPSAVGCSNDNFAIRPSSITLASTDATWNTAGTSRALNNTAVTGGNVHAAGQPFTLTVSPQPATASNYNTTSFSVTSGYPTCNLPASCTLATPALGTFTAAGSGVQQSSTASYPEVGTINLQLEDDTFAAVDAADGTPNTCSNAAPIGTNTCSSATLALGRFVPDHFDAVKNTPQFQTFGSNSACGRSFTYIGQPFWYATAASPTITLTARDAAGNAATNYRDASLFHLTTGMISQSYSNNATGPSLDTASIGSVSLTNNTDGTALISLNSGTISYTRNTATPASPFTANISLSVTASDTSETGIAGNPTAIATVSSPVVFNGSGSGIAFDLGAGFRYGRLRLASGQGSEWSPYLLQVEAQYWDGTYWRTNTVDSCTAYASNAFTVSGPTGTTASTATGLNQGYGSLMLNKPTSAGTATICADMASTADGCTATPASLEYLRGNWGAATYTKDPSASVIFGGANSNSRGNWGFLYRRENF